MGSGLQEDLSSFPGLRSYLLGAVYDWLVDNSLTPYLLLDATHLGVEVPEEHVQAGKITLNIAPQAIRDLKITPRLIKFDTRFSGRVYHVQSPVSAVCAIYSQEDQRGMVFSDQCMLVDDEKSLYAALHARKSSPSRRRSGFKMSHLLSRKKQKHTPPSPPDLKVIK